MASLGVFPRLDQSDKTAPSVAGQRRAVVVSSFMEKLDMITRIDAQVPIFKAIGALLG
jgi:hypothetical protein